MTGALMTRFNVVLLVVSTLSLLGQAPKLGNTQDLQQALNEISRPGLTYRRIDNYIAELRDTLTGWNSVKTLQAPDEPAIRSWAAARSIPVIEVNPAQVDTSRWSGWYNYWTTVPVSNGDTRIQTQVYDFDGNGLPEIYGGFGLIGFTETRSYEVNRDGSSSWRYSYGQNLGTSRQIVDFDRNGMKEIVFMYGTFAYVYEQATTTSLPTDLKFAFNKYNLNAAYCSIEHMHTWMRIRSWTSCTGEQIQP